MRTTLVLASTSPFRKAILEKLQIPFKTASPDVDEQHLSGESPEQLVARLSEAKAKAVAQNFSDALIIGSDQVAVVDGHIMEKPGNHQKAIAQLKRASGKELILSFAHAADRFLEHYEAARFLDIAFGQDMNPNKHGPGLGPDRGKDA